MVGLHQLLLNECNRLFPSSLEHTRNLRWHMNTLRYILIPTILNKMFVNGEMFCYLGFCGEVVITCA